MRRRARGFYSVWAGRLGGGVLIVWGKLTEGKGGSALGRGWRRGGDESLGEERDGKGVFRGYGGWDSSGCVEWIGK